MSVLQTVERFWLFSWREQKIMWTWVQKVCETTVVVVFWPSLYCEMLNWTRSPPQIRTNCLFWLVSWRRPRSLISSHVRGGSCAGSVWIRLSAQETLVSAVLHSAAVVQPLYFVFGAKSQTFQCPPPPPSSQVSSCAASFAPALFLHVFWPNCPQTNQVLTG